MSRLCPATVKSTPTGELSTYKVLNKDVAILFSGSIEHCHVSYKTSAVNLVSTPNIFSKILSFPWKPSDNVLAMKESTADNFFHYDMETRPWGCYLHGDKARGC